MTDCIECQFFELSWEIIEMSEEVLGAASKLFRATFSCPVRPSSTPTKSSFYPDPLHGFFNKNIHKISDTFVIVNYINT